MRDLLYNFSLLVLNVQNFFITVILKTSQVNSNFNLKNCQLKLTGIWIQRPKKPILDQI